MPRYFLHLRDGTDETLDPEGRELVDMDELKDTVMREARDVISGDVRKGLVDLRYRIDAEDEEGTLLYSLPFSGAVSILTED